MNVLHPINIICFILRYYCFVVYMNLFNEKRKLKNTTKVVGIGIYFILTSIIPDLGVWGNRIVMILSNCVLTLFLYIHLNYRIILSIFMWILIGSVSEYTILYLLKLIYSGEIIFGTSYFYLGMVLSWSLLAFIVHFIETLFHGKRNGKITRKQIWILCYLASLTALINVLTYKMYIHSNNKMDGLYAIMISLAMIGGDIAILKMYDYMRNTADLETQNCIYKTQIEAYKTQTTEREETIKEFRRLRHDMKNHLLYVEGLLRNNKKEEADTYVQGLISSPGFTPLGIVHSGNLLIDGLINYKAPYIKSLDIALKTEILIPDHLNIPEDRLCVILGNLLDNAIEGTQKLDKKQRNIEVIMRFTGHQLLLSVENTCHEERIKKKGTYFFTTKRECGEHGIGLESVRRAVEECDGTMDIQYSLGKFWVSVILPEES